MLASSGSSPFCHRQDHTHTYLLITARCTSPERFRFVYFFFYFPKSSYSIPPRWQPRDSYRHRFVEWDRWRHLVHVVQGRVNKKKGVTWISKRCRQVCYYNQLLACGSDVCFGLGLGGWSLAWRLAELLVKVNKMSLRSVTTESRNYCNQSRYSDVTPKPRITPLSQPHQVIRRRCIK